MPLNRALSARAPAMPSTTSNTPSPLVTVSGMSHFKQLVPQLELANSSPATKLPSLPGLPMMPVSRYVSLHERRSLSADHSHSVTAQDDLCLFQGGSEALSHWYCHRAPGQRLRRHRVRHYPQDRQQGSCLNKCSSAQRECLSRLRL